MYSSFNTTNIMSDASFCVVLCVSFCTGRVVMVPLNVTCLQCLQHSSLNISSIYMK